MEQAVTHRICACEAYASLVFYINFNGVTAQSKIQFQLGHSSNYDLSRSMLEFQVQHLKSQPNCMIKVRLLSCHNQNGIQPQPKWTTTSTKMKDDLTQNGRRPKWKTTKMEDDQNGRRPKWKTTKMEDYQK